MPWQDPPVGIGSPLAGLSEGQFLVGGAAGALAALSTSLLLLSGGALAFGSGLRSPTIGPDADSQHALPNAASDTVALLSATQTLANKTLSAVADLSMSGQIHEKQAADIASANTLTLSGGNSFVVTGGTQINGIVTTGHQDGCQITLLFYHTTTGPLIKHASGAPGTNAVPIYLQGNVDWQTTGFPTGNEQLVLRLATRNNVRGWYEEGRVAGLTSSIPGFNLIPNSQAVQLRLNNFTDLTHLGITAANLGAAFFLKGTGTTTGIVIQDANAASMMASSGAIGGTPRITFDALLKYPTANVQSTVGAAGGASALPATPSGYLKFDVNGTVMAVPYYAAS